MDAITLKFRYTKQDYISAMHLHNRKKYSSRQALPVYLTMLGVIAFFYSKHTSLNGYLIWLAIYVVAMAALVFSTPYRTYNRKSKFYTDMEFEFTEEDVHVKSEFIDTQLVWRLFERVIEDDNNYLLYVDKSSFQIIPKRVFESKAQEQEFRDLLARKITSAQMLTRAV